MARLGHPCWRRLCPRSLAGDAVLWRLRIPRLPRFLEASTAEPATALARYCTDLRVWRSLVVVHASVGDVQRLRTAPKRTKPYEPGLCERLRDPEYALTYLRVALEHDDERQDSVLRLAA